MFVSNKQGMRFGDVLLLAAYCLLLGGFTLWYDRPLTSHETVGCINIREMIADGDWIIPHYGERPWLERPPLPFWLTIPLVKTLGDVAQAYRLAPLLTAIPCVILLAWMATMWFGRGLGLLSGLILATIREFTHYATGPECDVFLCTVVTAALFHFVYLEFACPRTPDEGGIMGRRPWALVGFFLFLGLANLVKGLFFGDIQIMLPVVAFLLLDRDRWKLTSRYVWLPGWLIFALAGTAWASSAYWRYPDIVDLWKSDYLGRYNQGYMREPIWYYFAHLPLVLFPWTFAAVVGLWVTADRALKDSRSPERFLWCWALAPLAFLTIPQGKHHHYLLHSLPAWAALAALGTARFWQWLGQWNGMRLLWPGLAVVLVAGEMGLLVFRQRLGTHVVPAMILWPILILACGWILAQKDLRPAMIGMFVLLLPAHWLGHASMNLFADRYQGDLAFIQRARECLSGEDTVLVLDENGPLDASWMMYYLGRNCHLLHHSSFLLLDRWPDDVYLITRRTSLPAVSRFGDAVLVEESNRSRDEHMGPQTRYGLYRVRRHTDLARVPGKIYISPMQATGRALGPEVESRPAGMARK